MKLLFFTLNLVSALLLAQLKTRSYIIDPKSAPREHNVDFKRMKLELNLEPSKGLVVGRVTHQFIPLQQQVDSIVLDAINMTIKKIKINGKSVKYKNDSSIIVVFPNAPLAWGTTDSLFISYEVKPRKGLYFIGWNDLENISRKQIWSQGQGVDNRHWIPMYDEMNDKLNSEVIVKFDKDYKVLSNGNLIKKKDNKDGTLTWHYAMTRPHAPYLIMLGIGKYDIKETKSKSGVPMHLYYYPDWSNRVESTYVHSEAMVDFFEKEIGVPYGWESYSQLPVQDFMYGAMENTTATVFGDFLFVDGRSYLDRNYVGVNAHELAHQWFGDLVTARNSTHHWLQESFATYYNQLFEREVFGEDYFDWARRNAQNAAIEESGKNNFPVASSLGGSVRHYPKGAFVLNMLKNVVGGRETYNKIIRNYLEKHKYENVDSEDLLTAVHETTGLSLDWFWEEWVYKGGEPSYEVTFSELDNKVQFVVIQHQEMTDVTGLPVQGENNVNGSKDPFISHTQNNYKQAGLYKMPIWFEVYYKDGTMDKKYSTIENQTEIISFANTAHKKIDFVLFDPNNIVLKSTSFIKSFEMLEAQVLRAPHMLDRYDALLAMETIPLDKKRELLIKIFAKETFHAIKSEVVRQLANDNNSKSSDVIKSAFVDKDVMVRKAVLREVNTISPEMLPLLERMLTDSSYEVVESSLVKLCQLNPSKTASYLELCKNIEGAVGRNVITRWLEIAWNNSNDKQYVDKLLSYSSNSYEFRTRVNAMEALKRVNYFDIGLVGNLTNAILSSNSRLSAPAFETLSYFFEQDKYTKVISDQIRSMKLEGWQLAKLSNFILKS